MLRFCPLRTLVFLGVFFFQVLPSSAEVNFSTPGNSNLTLAHCQDYFRYEWGTPLDMSDSDHGPLSHIPAQQTRETNGLNYSGGKLSFQTSGASAQLMLLQYTAYDSVNNVKGAIPVGTRYGEAHPIDSSKYRYLAVRMYSEKDVVAQILWSEGTSRYAITTFPVLTGWHTYVIDLANAPIASSIGANIGWSQGNWEGLELYPSNVSGVSMSIDWVQLLGGLGCGSGATQFTATESDTNNLFTLVYDDDTDPTNGMIYSQVYGMGSNTDVIDTKQFFPGSYRVYGIQSSDWATGNLLNPFDMSDSNDINWNLVSPQIANPSVANGVFSGSTTGGDPSFDLNLRGQTINGSVYNRISIGLNVSFPQGVTSNSLDVWYQVGGSIHMIRTATVPGSQVLNITPGGSWNGQISRIRIDPANDISGVTFSVDFVAVRSQGFVSSLSLPSSQTASSNLVINDLYLGMLQPDEKGGRDFAQTVLGKAWNMDSVGDIASLSHVASAEVLPFNTLSDPAGNVHINDFFRAYTIQGNGDPQFPLLLFDSEHKIDTTQFVNFCFRGWNTTESNNFNSVARFLWHDASGQGGNGGFRDGDDVIMRRDNHEYCLDLKKGIPLEPPLPNGAPNPWTSISQGGSSVDMVRVDMSESIEGGHSSILDSVTLRTDHESNTRYAIVVSEPLDIGVDLYSNSSATVTGGSYIGSLSAGRSSNVFSWDTTNVTNGTYYIYGTVSKNGNTLPRLAEGRILVNHAFTQDTTSPVLNCERPNAGYTFDTQLEVAGYALDETRLATIEMFVDGQYVRSITPDRYHKDARTLYPSYADANSPGFQIALAGGGYSYGEHTVSLVATDTAGNTTTCSNRVVRGSGQDTPLLAYPSPDGVSQTYPDISTPTPVPAPATPSLRVSIAKDVVTFTVQDSTACSTFSLIGSPSSKLTGPTAIGSYAAGSSAIVRAKKAVAYNGRAKKGKDITDGKLYFQVQCGGKNSRAIMLNARSIKSKSKIKTEAGVLKKIKALAKRE